MFNCFYDKDSTPSLYGCGYAGVSVDSGGIQPKTSEELKQFSTYPEPYSTNEGYPFGWNFGNYGYWKLSESTNNGYPSLYWENQIILEIGNKYATVYGEAVCNDVAPKIVNDRTMLPVRLVAESLGAKVEWSNDSPGIITIINGDITIVITIGSDTAIVSGESIDLDSPAFIENERTYVPIILIAESLGANVEWNAYDQQVIIKK